MKRPFTTVRAVPLVALCLVAVAASLSARELTLTDWRFFYTGADSSAAWMKRDSMPSSIAIAVPHTFPHKDPAAPPPAGIGWYLTDIPVAPALSGGDLLLAVDGVCLRGDVYVDGTPVGRSAFPYLPFRIDLTPWIKEKTTIRLALRVDNRLRERELPDTKANGWWHYGGLVRDVRLSAVPKQRIDHVSLQTLHHAGDTFDLALHLTPAGKHPDSVVLTVSPDALRHRRATIRGSDTVLRFGGVTAWTPESPFLYRFALVPWFNGKPVDTLRLTRGFCQMTVRQSALLLNGKPLYLRGMSRHDVLDHARPVPDREERRRDLVDLKELGVNFLRIAHFPQARDVYELCDSLGILVMDEIPAWKTDATFLGSPEGRAYGAAYAGSLVSAHGNHTCICLWSIGNQFASFREQVAAYVKAVAEETRRADRSRPVTFCSYYYQLDRGFPYVDIISINEYFGWELASLPLLSLVLDNLHRAWPGKPIIISEFGAQAAHGLRNPAPQLAGIFKSVLSKDLSEDHQALFLRAHMDTIWSRRAFVAGMTVWSYADYRCDLNKARTEAMPKGLNACGIVTEQRARKLAYEAVQQRYGMIRGQTNGDK